MIGEGVEVHRALHSHHMLVSRPYIIITPCCTCTRWTENSPPLSIRTGPPLYTCHPFAMQQEETSRQAKIYTLKEEGVPRMVMGWVAASPWAPGTRVGRAL